MVEQRVYNKYTMISQMYRNQCCQLRTNLRNTLRQKQITTYFESTRSKYKQYLQQNERDKIEYNLPPHDLNIDIDSQEKREEWLRDRVRELREVGVGSWWGILRKLVDAVGGWGRQGGEGGQGGEFWGWVQVGVVGEIVLVFQERYWEYKLTPISACILQQILHNLPKTPKLPLPSTFPQNLTTLLHSQPTLKQSTIYLHLLNTILYKYQYLSNTFVEQGLVHCLVKFIEELEQREDRDGEEGEEEVYLVVCVVYRVLRGLVGEKFGSSVEMVLLPGLSRLLCRTKSTEVMGISLKCLSVIAKTPKQPVLSHLYHQPSLPSLLLSLLLSPTPILRSSTTNILTSVLLSQNPTYARQLLHQDLLYKVEQCWKFKDNLQQCRNNLLKILGNLVSTCLEFGGIVVGDGVFGVVVGGIWAWVKGAGRRNGIGSQVSQEEYLDSISIISTLIQYECPQIIQTLLRKHSILHPLTQSLQSLPLQPCLQTLKCLLQIIQFQNSQQPLPKKNKRKIVLQLESLYDIQNVLEKLEDRLGEFGELGHYVDLIYQEMYGYGGD